MVAAIAAVGLAVLASDDGGGGVDAPDANDVDQQIQDLRDFIQDNSP